MRVFFSFLIVAFTIARPATVLADWVSTGVAYNCDESAKIFHLQGTVETSSPGDGGTISPLTGYTTLNSGLSTIECILGESKVVAEIRVVGPQAKGMCKGFGSISLEFLTVSEQDIFGPPQQFNSGCFFEPVLFDVYVQLKSNAPFLRACRGKWDWGVGYADAICSESEIR